VTNLDQVMELVIDTNTRTIEISGHLKEINGTIERHSEELFGNNSTKGVIAELSELHDYAVSTKSAIKVIVTLVSLIGIGNIVLMVTLLSRVGT